MAGEVTEAVKASVGCLFWMAAISVALTIGYFVLNIILYLIPVVLAIAIGLAVLQEVDKLHQHDDQAVRAVETQTVECGLQAGDVTVVVGAPDIDDLIEAAHGELIAVIGDIGGKVGVETVGAAKNIVL